MKFIKAFLDFWKKDIINKLIVLVLLALAGGVFVVGFLILSMPQAGSILTEAFGNFLPAASAPTFDINSYLTPNANVPAAPAATESYVFVPTFTPFIPSSPEPTLEPPTPVVELPSPTLELPTPAAPPTQQIQPTVAQLASGNFGCIPGNPPQTGKVLEVLDGNTVKVLMDWDKLIYYVRYLGVTAPEKTPYSETAKAENSKLVYGKVVTLVQDKTDKDDRGRLLRYVLAGGTFINLELIKLGLGSAADVPDVSCAQVFKQAQQAAQSALSGMWTPTATPKP